MFDSIDSLKRAGFEGFVCLSVAIQNTKLQSGVYLVLRDPALGSPRFRPKGTGGWFKRKNPNVDPSELDENWVDSALVLYIGKADVGKSGRGVSKRLDELHRFGSGKPVAHRGGKLLWQVADSNNFLVCWKYCDSPRAEEKKLLDHFERTYGKLPYANLRR